MRRNRDVTPAEAARRLGVGLDYIYALLWAGKIAGHKDGGKWRISEQALAKRLQSVSRLKKDQPTVVANV
jgi:excisionase family DNA binding protein